jgi:hypothetical protein
MPQRIIETLEGLGNIYRNDQKIADVRYALQVNQEYNLMGETLTLHLEDGHELKFVASHGNIMAGTYTVRGSGPIF